MKIKGKTEVTSSLKTSKKEQAAKLLNVKEEQKKPKKNFSKREKILFVVIFVLLLFVLLMSCPWIRSGLNQLFHQNDEIVEKATDKKKNTSKKSNSKKTDKSDNKKDNQDSNNNRKNGPDQTDSTTGIGSSSNHSSSNNQSGSENNGNNGNGGGNSEVTPPLPVTPIASFQLVSWEQSSVSMYQAPGSTTITFEGSLNVKSPLPSQGIYTGYYIQFMVVAPQNYSSSTLDNMHIVTATNEYHKHIDGYVNGLPFFYITQEVRPGMITPLSINWGDGQTINYTLSFQVETI